MKFFRTQAAVSSLMTFAGLVAMSNHAGADESNPNSATTDTPLALQLNTVTKLYKAWDNSVVPEVQAKNSGSGYWDPNVAYDPHTGDIAVLASMSSPTPNAARSRMQGAVGLLRMTESGLEEITPLKPLPTLAGQRAFMRPLVAYGSNFLLALGASEDAGNVNVNPQAVAFVLNRETGEVIPIANGIRPTTAGGPAAPALLTDKPTNLIQAAQSTFGLVQKVLQHGPHSICPLGPQPDGTEAFMVGVQQQNAQAQIMRVNVKVTNGRATVDVPYLNTFITNAAHNRVSLACPPSGYAGKTIVATAVQAVQQPADVGIRAALINTSNGAEIASKLIVPSNRANLIHAVQPTAAYVNENVVAIQYVMAQSKGIAAGVASHAANTVAQQSILATFTVSEDPAKAFERIDEVKNSSAYQRHPHAFGTIFGRGEGTSAVSVLSGSSTGRGPGVLQIIPVSNNGKLGAPSPRNLFEVSRESDVADNCSKNLRNAGQARCFINGLGGIVNPGFGKPKGFMPEVQTFNLTAVGAKAKPTDHRLSLFVNLTPSTWDGAIDQALPGSAKDPSEVPLGKSPRTTTANVPTIPTEKGDQGSAPDKDEEGVPGSKTTYRNSGSQASGCNVSGGLLRPHAVGEFTWLRPATVWVPVAGFVVAIASAFGRRRQRR